METRGAFKILGIGASQKARRRSFPLRSRMEIRSLTPIGLIGDGIRALIQACRIKMNVNCKTSHTAKQISLRFLSARSPGTIQEGATHLPRPLSDNRHACPSRHGQKVLPPSTQSRRTASGSDRHWTKHHSGRLALCDPCHPLELKLVWHAGCRAWRIDWVQWNSRRRDPGRV